MKDKRFYIPSLILQFPADISIADAVGKLGADYFSNLIEPR